MDSDLISRKALLEAMDNVRELMEEAMCIPSWATAKECIRTVKPVDRWIPCSERLPEDREEKLVYLSSNRTTIAIYNEHILPHSGMPVGWGFHTNNGYIDFETETVIAWMPLPEPYKAGDIDG